MSVIGIIIVIVIVFILLSFVRDENKWTGWHFSNHSRCNKCRWPHIMAKYKKDNPCEKKYRCANCDDTWEIVNNKAQGEK